MFKLKILTILTVLFCCIGVGYTSNDYGGSGNDAPNITGGTIDGATIGATTPSTGAFTTLSTTGGSGVGTTAPTVGLEIKGTTATDLPTYGAELLTSAGWTVNTGWTESPDDVFAHTGGGGTGTLAHSATIANATKYQISWTVSATPTGSFTISVGGQSYAGITATGSWGPTTSSTAVFTITPTTDFNGTISAISLRAITASSPVITVRNSSNSAVLTIGGHSNSSNTFIGNSSGSFNTTGTSNTFLGMSAGYNSTTGNGDTFIGTNAGYANTTGSFNSAIGNDALYANTTGSCNSALGRAALNANTTGSYNSAMGRTALYANTTGASNSALGNSALYANTTGANNSAIGNAALNSNTTGSYNSAIGVAALNSNTTGSNNSALGYAAGRFHADGTTSLTDAENSIYIGYGSRGYDNSDGNSIVIGYNAIGLGVNTTVLGNSSTTKTAIYGQLCLGATTPIGTEKLHVTGDVYVTGDISSATYTDHTPYYDGDAVAAIKGITGKDGGIDHSTLPAFARKTGTKKTYIDTPLVEVPKAQAFTKATDAEGKEVDVAKDGIHICSVTGKAFQKPAEGVVTRVNGKLVGRVETGEVTVERRDLGAMISVLTKAVQQLNARIEALEAAKIAVK